MLNGPIPAQIDPRKLADRGARLNGELPLSKFERIGELLIDTTGCVRVAFAFDWNEQKQVIMQLELGSQVRMVCQRCLEEAVLPISGRYAYVIVKPGTDSALLPQGYDVLEVDAHALDVLALVEDELLLALPVVPTHPQGVCRYPQGYVEPVVDEKNEADKNPFSVLAQLKRDLNV